MKDRQHLREELTMYHASRLAVEVPIEQGLRLVSRAWKDRDRDYVKLLAARTAVAAPATAVVFCAEELDPARIVVARSRDLDFDCGKMLREELALIGQRGGGSADLAQGEVPLKQVPALRTAICAKIRQAVAEAQASRS
jgi:alanyl-tRNA synthetase